MKWSLWSHYQEVTSDFTASRGYSSLIRMIRLDLCEFVWQWKRCAVTLSIPPYTSALIAEYSNKNHTMKSHKERRGSEHVIAAKSVMPPPQKQHRGRSKRQRQSRALLSKLLLLPSHLLCWKLLACYCLSVSFLFSSFATPPHHFSTNNHVDIFFNHCSCRSGCSSKYYCLFDYSPVIIKTSITLAHGALWWCQGCLFSARPGTIDVGCRPRNTHWSMVWMVCFWRRANCYTRWVKKSV